MKKKMKKVLVALLVAVVSFCTLTTSVNAVPQSLELGSTERLKGYAAGTYFSIKQQTNGDVVYCLDIHKGTARNITANLVGELDAGVAYIMMNGYPHKSFTGDRNMDYYITQTALWWYLDDTTGSSNLGNAFKTTGSDPNNLRPHIQNLVAQAKTAQAQGYQSPAIGASVSNDTMSISSDGKYYVSEDISVVTTNVSEYNVSITSGPEGTVAIDKDGNEKSTFAAGEGFRVQTPVSSVTDTNVTISVKLSGTGTINKAYEYQPTDQSQQSVTPSVISPVEESVESSIDLKISTSKITIVKVDKATGNNIAGAELVLKDADGNEIASWTTTTSGHVIKNLPNGTYTIEETKAPEGYELSKEPVTFTVDDNNREQTIEFYNEAKERVVNIIKVDQVTGNPLAGAVLVVRDSEGNEVARFTSTLDPYVLTDLEDGTYTVEEEQAPTGYQKTDEVTSFTIDANNVSHQITIENAPVVVNVPNTGTTSSILLVIVGLAIIGGGMKFVQKNSKKSRI